MRNQTNLQFRKVDETQSPIGKIGTNILSVVMLAIAVTFFGSSTHASNLLSNGDFNAPNSTAAPTGWTVWTWGGGWANHVNDASTFDGSYYMALGGFANAGAGVYQIVPASPGVEYTLSVNSGAQAWWKAYAEMRLFFLDAAGITLLQTNLATVNPSGYDMPWPWAPYSLVAVSPAGTTQVKVEFAEPNGTGTAWFDNAVLSVPFVTPSITGVYPDGVTLFQVSSTFSFTAGSTTTPINASGIQVILNGVDISTNLAVAGGLNSKTVSYAGLKTNMVYSAVIHVTDANGWVASSTVNFDTFQPTLVWEAEDWDFGGGQFINAPTLTSTPSANSYFGKIGVEGIDEHENGGTPAGSGDGPQLFRTNDPMATVLSSDTPRQKFLTAQLSNTNIADYVVGYFYSPEWVNYTRTFPAGTYNVYARAASGAAGVCALNLDRVSTGVGTSNQTTAALGSFKFAARGWDSYEYAPLTDVYSNLVAVNLSGPTTLRVTGPNSGVDLNFLMIVPAQLNLPVIGNIYPNGAALFQPTNTISFSVTSQGTTINAGDIHLTLNGVNVDSGLIVTGSSTSKSVSYAGLKTNVSYSASINVADVNGSTASAIVNFDTFNPVFVWEAEDWDYDGGHYIDNPVPSSIGKASSYFNRTGTIGIDENETGTLNTNWSSTLPNPPAVGDGGPGDHGYRTNDAMAATVSGDVPRKKFLDAILAGDANVKDYSLGWFASGEWVNFTKTFPSGKFNIYARLANGNGGTANGYIDQVTGGQGTDAQTTQPLGTFTYQGRGWNNYDYVPLRDRYGNIATVTLGGVQTLRLVGGLQGGGMNANFLMLVPADKPTISQIYPDGATLQQSTNRFSFVVANPAAAISQSAIQLTLNGVDVSSQLTFSGSPNSWTVSLPVTQNFINYAAVIHVADVNGNVADATVYFDTFDPASFTFEAEDFDFNGGKFIDNPAINAYAGQISVWGVDENVDADSSAAFIYRPYDYVGTQPCTDTPLLKFSTAALANPSLTNYNVGWWTANSWINYTRTFPSNSYFVYARLSGGSGTYNVQLDQMSGSTLVAHLGTFTGQGRGWALYDWVPLLNNGQPATISLNGVSTLRTTTDGNANANLYMLVPATTSLSSFRVGLSASAGAVTLSFATQNGHNYQIFYKNDLSEATWTLLSTVPGDGALKTIFNNTSGARRFFRVSAQ